MDPLTIAMLGLGALSAYGSYDNAQKQNKALEAQRRFEKAKSKWSGFGQQYMPEQVAPDMNPLAAGLQGGMGMANFLGNLPKGVWEYLGVSSPQASPDAVKKEANNLLQQMIQEQQLKNGVAQLK